MTPFLRSAFGSKNAPRKTLCINVDKELMGRATDHIGNGEMLGDLSDFIILALTLEHVFDG